MYTFWVPSSTKYQSYRDQQILRNSTLCITCSLYVFSSLKLWGKCHVFVFVNVFIIRAQSSFNTFQTSSLFRATVFSCDPSSLNYRGIEGFYAVRTETAMRDQNIKVRGRGDLEVAIRQMEKFK